MSIIPESFIWISTSLSPWSRTNTPLSSISLKYYFTNLKKLSSGMREVQSIKHPYGYCWSYLTQWFQNYHLWTEQDHRNQNCHLQQCTLLVLVNQLDPCHTCEIVNYIIILLLYHNKTKLIVIINRLNANILIYLQNQHHSPVLFLFLLP